jgi:hypothetical protein
VSDTQHVDRKREKPVLQGRRLFSHISFCFFVGVSSRILAES